MSATITPEVGKRYVTRGGWVTPPLGKTENPNYPLGYKVGPDIIPCWTINGREKISGSESYSDLISEYVDPAVTDTFRRDLIARLYVAMVGGLYAQPDVRSFDSLGLANSAIRQADTLIEAMEVSK